MADTLSPAAHRAVMIVLVPLMLVLFITNLDATIVATALPTIGREFGDMTNVPWIATAYLITSAITTLIFGKLGDMYGRKRIFQISIITFLVGSVLAGGSGSLGWLIAFRALQGIGGGGLNSLVQAILGDIVPARQRSKYTALTGIVATGALIAGPFLGGLFSDTISWRWIFYINIPIGIIAVIIIGLRVHLPRPTSTARVDVVGALLAALFTTAALLMTSLANSKVGGVTLAWSSPAIIGLIALSVLSLVAFLVVERGAAAPITPLGMFRSSVFTISSVQFFLATLVLFVGMLYVPLFLQNVQGYSAFVAGLFLIPLLVGLIVATAVAGPLIAKSGHYKQYPIIGAVLTGAAMAVLSLSTAATPAILILALLFVAGAGIGLFVQVALLGGQNAVEYGNLGVATGALNFFKSIGGAFGAALFGAILAAGLHGSATKAAYTDAFHSVFGWTVPFMALALILGIIMREKPLSTEMVAVAAGKVEVPEY